MRQDSPEADDSIRLPSPSEFFKSPDARQLQRLLDPREHHLRRVHIDMAKSLNLASAGGFDSLYLTGGPLSVQLSLRLGF
jgi:hypothetical protein